MPAESLAPSTSPRAGAMPVLVQVTGPGQGGVRDYLDSLQQAWAAEGLPSETLVLSSSIASEASLASRLAHVAGSDPCTLLLHYSGYGLHPRGLCHWLLREVEGARSALGPRLRVVTMFHELFASGPPWRSAFWLAGVQAGIAARLAQACDAVATNSQHHARWLQQKLKPGTAMQVRPVFSTIGEPLTVQAMNLRRPQLVVFGAPSTRGRALLKLPHHTAALRAQGIAEVLEVGSGEAVPGLYAGLRHRHLGHVDVQTLRCLLGASQYALIDYPSIHLGKSSVFAAYAAHGCVVLNTAAPGPDADGLHAGVHQHWLGHADRAWPTDLQTVSDATRRWYLQHAIGIQMRDFAHLCSRPLRQDEKHA